MPADAHDAQWLLRAYVRLLADTHGQPRPRDGRGMAPWGLIAEEATESVGARHSAQLRNMWLGWLTL
jgi:hypothetical protein